MPCTVPSSPNGPCSIGMTTSIGPTARTLLSVPPARGMTEFDDEPGSSASRSPSAAGSSSCQAPSRLIVTPTTS